MDLHLIQSVSSIDTDGDGDGGADVGSRLDCARACFKDAFCYGMSYVRNYVTNSGISSKTPFSDPNVCYHYKEYITADNCDGHDNPPSVSSSRHVYFQKWGVCYNGGTWNRDKNRCTCVQDTGFVGKFCERRPRNCEDFSMAGFDEMSEDMEIQPYENGDKVTIRCVVRGDGYARTLVAYNRITSDSFNVPWAQYEDGIGKVNELPNAYWLGLKNIRGILQTTTGQRTLSVEVRYGGGVGFIGEMNIHNVQLSNSTDGYRLTYRGHEQTGRFSGMSGFCFQNSNGLQFSTLDRDSDDDQGQNCAVLNKSGWWFSACESPCNLFGDSYTYDSRRRGPKESYSSQQVRLVDTSLYDLSYYLHHIAVYIKS